MQRKIKTAKTAKKNQVVQVNYQKNYALLEQLHQAFVQAYQAKFNRLPSFPALVEYGQEWYAQTSLNSQVNAYKVADNLVGALRHMVGLFEQYRFDFDMGDEK